MRREASLLFLACVCLSWATAVTTRASSWQADHDDVSGVVLSQQQALRLGIDIFGDLLDNQARPDSQEGP